VEVQITREDFIGALAREHHLDAHGFDLAALSEEGGGGGLDVKEERGCRGCADHEEHRRRGAHGGGVEGLEVVDDLPDGV
jgi:hypothetical protein